MGDDLFRDFRQEFSNAYLGNKKLELKFLLQDHISIGDLAKNKSGMNLFTVLKDKGLITYTNVKLLSEIADVTENILAKTCVTKYKRAVGSQYDDRGGASLSLYRQTLYKAMCLITEDRGGDLENLIDHYGLDSLGFKNKWDLEFHLEKEVKLNKTQKLLTDFANQLNAQAKILLLEVAGGSGVTGGGGGLTTKPTGKHEIKVDVKSGKIVKPPTTEITQDDFKHLRTIVSAYYDARPDCHIMLMVLFGDHVTTQKHTTINTTIDLLDALDESNDLSSNDISIVYDTINLTGHYALQRKLKAKISFPEVKPIEITNFSNYRQKIMKFGKGITPNDVATIDGHYNNPVKKYKSSWGMIYDLEFEQSIFKESNIDEFVANLKQCELPSSSAKLLE